VTKDEFVQLVGLLKGFLNVTISQQRLPEEMEVALRALVGGTL
jgi:hypothetical protein